MNTSSDNTATIPDCWCWNDPELAARGLYCPACDTQGPIPLAAAIRSSIERGDPNAIRSDREPAPAQIVVRTIRARLSRGEWVEFRRLALSLNVSAETLAGRAIRELLQAQGRPSEGSVKT